GSGSPCTTSIRGACEPTRRSGSRRRAAGGGGCSWTAVRATSWSWGCWRRTWRKNEPIADGRTGPLGPPPRRQPCQPLEPRNVVQHVAATVPFDQPPALELREDAGHVLPASS